MINFLIMLSIIASSDGEYLQIQVPPNWGHVLVSVQPHAGFHEVSPNTYRGYTTATSGVVHGTICTSDRCEIVEESFDSVIIVPSMKYAELTPWRFTQCLVLFLSVVAALLMGTRIVVRGIL